MGTKLLLVVLLAMTSMLAPAVAVQASSAAAEKLLPVDEAATDPTFARFRDELRSIAQNRDIDRLIPLLGTEVVTFDGRRSRDEFVVWLRRGTAPDREAFWTDLAEALQFGFAKMRDVRAAFCAPYPAEMMDQDFNRPQGAIMGANVNVRAKPTISSEVIERLSYDIVDLRSEQEPAAEIDKGQHTWLDIQTPSGKVGWVLSKYVWRFGMPRACVRKDGGQWRLWSVAETD
jgi:Bacterial SH3 domain